MLSSGSIPISPPATPLFQLAVEQLDARSQNRLRSPKRGGTCVRESRRYLDELGIAIVERRRPIQFTPNFDEPVHRWAPYIQGFSASFVQSVLDRYRFEYSKPRVLDPFAGCGTVLVNAKLNGYESFGVELNPLLHFMADMKVNSWAVDPAKLVRAYDNLPPDSLAAEPAFLKSQRQFNHDVLLNLRRAKGAIDSFVPIDEEETTIKNLLNVAFASILTDCSNLKRTPCLGYCKDKKVEPNAPFTLLRNAVYQIADDLNWIRLMHTEALHTRSQIVCANSMEYEYCDTYDLAITSPPYMNGLDYVMNYKIEMAWLGFTSSHKEAKAIKDQLVVCDNVSKGLIKRFNASRRYTNSWIEEIASSIAQRIQARGRYRRSDMPWIVRKYFDVMYRVMRNVSAALAPNGRFVLVVGDSLIADTYVPTDLILARIGRELELSIEGIELARTRHSGQIRDYRLRETIVTLRK